MTTFDATYPDGVTAAPQRSGRFHVFPAGRMCSLRRAMLVWLVPLFLLVAATSAAVSYWTYGRMVNEFMDEQMRQLAQSVAAQQTPSVATGPADRSHDKGTYLIQLWNRAGGLQDGSPVVTSRPQSPGFHDVAEGGTAWRVFATPLLNGEGTVQVLQSGSFRRHLATDRAIAAIAPMALLLALALAVLWSLAGAMSRAVQEIGQHAARQDATTITSLPLDRVPLEIRPMVEAFNHLLARLQEAFTSQRRLVQDAAHELRTPITALALQMENVRRDMPEGACQKSFAQLESGMQRAQRLVDQLLTLSHQQSAPLEAPAIVTVQEQVRDCVGALMPLADQQRIDLGFESQLQGAGAVALRCAPADLRTVLDNLVENALRYTPEGGVVDVRLGGDARRWWLEVVDTGPGIAPEHQQRVFDRFFRVPGSAARGSGLGLAIAQEAARRCGLRVALRNRADRSGLVARIEQA